MTELDVKLVKVDNWGIFFLQRLKHFFNRTDYCDLTLQFQDNAQLKVHRLVLSACTEYFEILERTCEMYEDCLVMPDDLQADVVVPIVNFMYTGQLEFRMDLLERLYQTSQIMNMPVLTKLLDAHRIQCQPALNNISNKRSYSKTKDLSSKPKQTPAIASSSKRPYYKAFGNTITPQGTKKAHLIEKDPLESSNRVPPPTHSPNITPRKLVMRDPRPTRYELPEELDTDNVFDNSFTNISYTSQPLMVHPETTKQYQRKKSNTNIFDEGSSLMKIGGGTSTLDIVECKPVKKENIFDDHSVSDMNEDLEMFSVRDQTDLNNANQLFDQIIDQPAGPKVTIETKDSQSNNIDHAKIISEVLKKYPHLMKSNKNIKLKILNTPTTPNTVASKAKPKKQRNSPTPYKNERETSRLKSETTDCTFETDVLDSKEAARLIAMGAENVKGPWICLICGTPGKALHFTTYYKFRRHLVEVHNEKPVANMCEYCGLRSLKRNYLLHHLLTKHGIDPPPQYHFPKCNVCNYVALTEGLLVKHKMTHSENRTFRCNVCSATYPTSGQLLVHIQNTGHKYCADRKTNLQCVYCLKVFLREGNLYAHLKTYHRQVAKTDGIIDDSDEETQETHKEEEIVTPSIKYEPQNYDTEYDELETQYQIRPDGNIELITKPVNKPRLQAITPSPVKQKILNTGLQAPPLKPVQPAKQPTKSIIPIQAEERNEEIVMIDNNEYIMKDNQLIPKKKGGNTYIIPEVVPETNDILSSSTSMEFTNIQDSIEETSHEQKMIIKKATNLNQPIQIVVSNEEEYKALMNSNHSIIFDDGDANKTLTVLSTPHNAAINTLDLDNTQSNDMMIIQDNYPINVSEALPGDNSNIVVVYSHSVDEHNKQFQLISSQNIGAQFVQSSAVITQNFATPTTVTPVMGTHVIESQIGQSWQSNNQVNQTVPEVAELQEMEIAEQAEIIPLEQAEIVSVQPTVVTSVDSESVPETHNQDTSMQHTELSAVELAMENIHKELPEVTLATEVSQEATELEIVQNETGDILHQTNENDNESLPFETSENDNIETVKEAQNIPLQTLEEDMSADSATINTTDTSENVVMSPTNEHLQQETLNTDPEESRENEQQLQDPPIEQTIENNIEEEQASLEENNAVNQVPESTENDPAGIDNENITEQTSTVMTPVSVSEKIKIPEERKEQIQSLASEWSDDEYDIEEQADENIEKQTSEVSGDTEDSANDKLPEQEASTLPDEPPQAKISLLLNDWDENDSQEGNDSTNGTEDEPMATDAAGDEEIKEGEMVILENVQPKKDDKIKSLVSDWDDDDDENKQ